MSKLYAIAGRPGTGKTLFLNKLMSESGNSFKLISAYDFSTHEGLMKKLHELVQDDCCKSIAIDDYEAWLVGTWNEKIDDDEYQKDLSILAGFSDSYDINILVVVGLKREADSDMSTYADKSNLRSRALSAEADGVYFIKHGGTDIIPDVKIISELNLTCGERYEFATGRTAPSVF